MIEKISLKNFKCFEKIDVTCRELNLFTVVLCQDLVQVKMRFSSS